LPTATDVRDPVTDLVETAVATEFALKAPTVPIPVHKLLKVVAIVDPANAETRQLFDQIAGAGFVITIGFTATMWAVADSHRIADLSS
jgi:hypothetical protein